MSQQFAYASSDTSGSSAPVKEAESNPLFSSNMAIIKQHFSETTPFSLPRGHPAIALNEGQICSILKVVPNESACASLDMLNSVVQAASRLNLGECAHQKKPCSSTARVNPLFATDSVLECPSRDTYLSRTDYSSDISHDNASEGPSTPTPGYPSSQGSVVHIPSPPRYGCSRVNPGAQTPTNATYSPEGQTLASLKQDTIKDRRQSRNVSRPHVAPKAPRKKTPRRGKIIREEYIEEMSWTPRFVSGPLDPEHNPSKLYCLFCKDNVSLNAKGPREITLRHYSSERHLRKDQHWRYEHLSVTDTSTGMVKHRVRGRDGKLLTPYQLELELPKFIDAILVDIGDKLPFYEEYLAGQ